MGGQTVNSIGERTSRTVVHGEREVSVRPVTWMGGGGSCNKGVFKEEDSLRDTRDGLMCQISSTDYERPPNHRS